MQLNEIFYIFIFLYAMPMGNSRLSKKDVSMSSYLGQKWRVRRWAIRSVYILLAIKTDEK